jgi:hypothetical protein
MERARKQNPQPRGPRVLLKTRKTVALRRGPCPTRGRSPCEARSRSAQPANGNELGAACLVAADLLDLVDDLGVEGGDALDGLAGAHIL